MSLTAYSCGMPVCPGVSTNFILSIISALVKLAKFDWPCVELIIPLTFVKSLKVAFGNKSALRNSHGSAGRPAATADGL